MFVVESGLNFTDVGKSGWILFLAGYVFFAGFAASKHAASYRVPAAARLLTAAAAYIFITVALSGLAANVLKRVIGRARPHFSSKSREFSAFRPSPTIPPMKVFPRATLRPRPLFLSASASCCRRCAYALLIAGIWIGLARVIVGAHYPSDVIAGLALGAWFALAVAARFARYGILFAINSAGWPELRYPHRAHGSKQLGRYPPITHEKARRKGLRRAFSVSISGRDQSMAWISRSLVSGRNSMPMTSVMPAKMIGYQRP